MSEEILALRPEKDDLVVVPDNVTYNLEGDFHIYPMKHLQKPSIIKSGGSVSILESLGLKTLADWLSTREVKVDDTKWEELPAFFRHVRSVDLNNFSRPGPRDGVTLLFVLDAANHRFRFSYSMCRSDENFNYAIARGICENRFNHGDFYEIINFDNNFSLVDAVEIALENHLTNPIKVGDNNTRFSVLSHRSNDGELKKLQKKLKKLYLSEKRA